MIVHAHFRGRRSSASEAGYVPAPYASGRRKNAATNSGELLS